MKNRFIVFQQHPLHNDHALFSVDQFVSNGHHAVSYLAPNEV